MPVSEATHVRKYVFQMKSFSYDITFAAKKASDYDMWMQALQALQKETERRKMDIIKKQRIEDEESSQGEPRQEVKMTQY